MSQLIQSRLDRPGNPIMRLGLWTLLMSVGAFGYWAYETELPHVVRSEIIIEPAGEVQQIQHPDGGTLAELLVRSGDQVEAGQVLLRIDRTRAASNLDENEARQRALRARMSRLKAEAMNQPYSPQDPAMSEQVATYRARQQGIKQQQQVLDERIEGVSAQLASNQTAIGAARDALASANRELQQFERLQESGAVSDVEVLRLQREVRERQASVDQLTSDGPRLRAERQALQQERASIEVAFRQKAQEELLQVEVELESLESLASGIADRVQATEVIAPTAGILGEIRVNTIGQVIRAGDVLMEIVPRQDQLAARAEVAPADIGFVAQGQPVNIRLSAFDFTRFGVLKGEVQRIGANTLQEQNKEPFYPVKVELMSQALAQAGDDLDLRVGMRGTADVVIGQRKVLDYLLTPLSRVRYEAFTE